jgi:hypothetical protein
MPDIYRVMLLRTVVFACQSDTPLRFLTLCKSGLPLLFSAGRRSIDITQGNHNQVFRGVHVSAHLWVRASRLHLLQCGGGRQTHLLVACAVLSADGCVLRKLNFIRSDSGLYSASNGNDRLQVCTLDGFVLRRTGGYKSVGRLVVGVAVAIDAGCLGPIRKLDKISQDIKRFVAIRID